MADFKDILKTIQGSVDSFNELIPAAQKGMLAAVNKELKDLDLTSDGNIKNSVANLKLIGKIKKQLQDLILTDKYLKNVQEFADTFTAVTELQNSYWTEIESEFKPSKLLGEIKSQAVTDTVNSLTEQGVGAQISQDITDILQTNITAGGSYEELTEQLRTAMLGDDKTPGLLSKYAKLITTDSLNQYSAQYTKAVSDDLGYEWFAYQGSDIETTRPFCFAMTQNRKFFHVSEIPGLLAAEDLYYKDPKTGEELKVPIYDKTGLPQGMYPGTNPSNFQILRGGYNCGHQIRPVSEKIVPAADKARVASG